MNNKQTILVADKNGNHTGQYMDKDLAHTGLGKRHLAITVLLYNNKGQVLLQHRKHKIHSDIWDLTGSTHHLHKSDGSNETTEEATYRCLKSEYGIFKKIPLKVLGGVNYYAADGENCENEHDIIVAGEFNGKLKANREVAHKHEWVDEKLFLTDIIKNPKKYAPWAVLATKLLKDYKVESDFELLLKSFLIKFNEFESGYFKAKIKETSKYPKLISGFYENLADFTKGGKKMRAFLVYLGYLIGGKNTISPILPVSLAVEIIHSFLLVHDDIIDKSDIRRKKATIHMRYEKLFGAHYGTSQAIILGDLACIEALSLVNSSTFDNEQKLLCLSKIEEVILETLYGEALDVEYSYRRPKIADIMQIADLKTARYSFVGPLTIGGILSGCSKNQLVAMSDFGLLVGLAFQIQDDYLGVFGDEKVLGKSVLSDMREGKNTLLIYKAQELGKAEDRQMIGRLWGKNNATIADLEKIKKIIESCGAEKWCKKEMQRLVDRALKNVEKITKDAKLKKIIIQMAEFVVDRQK